MVAYRLYPIIGNQVQILNYTRSCEFLKSLGHLCHCLNGWEGANGGTSQKTCRDS